LASGSSTANLPCLISGLRRGKASGGRGGLLAFPAENAVPPMTASPAWSLHPQLQRDTINIGELPLARVLIINDANYPWLLLVPRRPAIVEIIDLDEVEQAQLMTEIARVGRALKVVTQCDKLNIATLGNVVPQLHVHIIARRHGDAAWPRPVWGHAPPLAFPRRRPDIRRGRLAVDEPLANRVRSGRKQPERAPVRVARQPPTPSNSDGETPAAGQRRQTA
jgi:diadenosine tetraphosphate (Ap4A) HIT family hydrolase